MDINTHNRTLHPHVRVCRVLLRTPSSYVIDVYTLLAYTHNGLY
jgi:hypothetical protein